MYPLVLVVIGQYRYSNRYMYNTPTNPRLSLTIELDFNRDCGPRLQYLCTFGTHVPPCIHPHYKKSP